MTRQAQKEREERHLRELLRSLGLRAVTLRFDRERPDCVAVIDGRRIGIEHCEVGPQNRMHGTGAADIFKREVTRALEEANLPWHVEFGVPPDLRSQLSIDRGREIGRWLVSELRGRTEPFKVQSLIDHGLGVPGRLYAWPNSVASTGVSGGGMGSADLAPIRDLIARKGKALTRYRAQVGADQYWLLLVTGAKAGASIPDFVVAADEFERGEFDRVFYLDLQSSAAPLELGAT